MTELTLEDWNTEEEIEFKPFYIETYFRGTKKDTYDSAELAAEEVTRRIHKNPFATSEYYVIEIKSIMKSMPVAETNIQTVDVQGWVQEQQLKLEQELKQTKEQTDV